ncbi:hypothetical protein K9M79_08715 [Candidatus Woesearchaeota archaeon]|nr:hypothetical protein [Candidatus Woesearchaeota archaeon]
MLNYDMYKPMYKPRTSLLKRAAFGGMLLLSAYAGDHYNLTDRLINPVFHGDKPVRSEMYQSIDTLRLEKKVRDGVREVYLTDIANKIRLPVDTNMHVGRSLSAIIKKETEGLHTDKNQTAEDSREVDYMDKSCKTLKLIERKMGKLFNRFYKWLEEEDG